MRWRAFVKCGTLACIAAAAPDLAGERQRLLDAKHAATIAQARAAQFAAEAKRERGAAARSRTQAKAAAARVAAAEADLAAARARTALASGLVAAERDRVAAAEAPVARLLAGLSGLARRPAIAELARPGSVGDLVHLRAVLDDTLPAVRRRTAGLAVELGRARRLEGDRRLAAEALAASRSRLAAQQTALATLADRQAGHAAALGRSALAESDRAIVMGEAARDIVDRMAEEGGARAVMGELRTLPGPPAPAPAAHAGARPYHLPATGTLVTGFDEVDAAGVRSRGLTLALSSGAVVIAPAGGHVVFAQAFRRYGRVVIIDHGAGWTTLLTGLGTLFVHAGRPLRAGAPLGRAAGPVTLELRRRGRPVDAAQLL